MRWMNKKGNENRKFSRPFFMNKKGEASRKLPVPFFMNKKGEASRKLPVPFFMNKKGDENLYYTVIFIVLNVLFFASIMVFVVRTSEGALVYEQAYAKQIALLVDKAQVGMEIKLDVTKVAQMAKKKGVSMENAFRFDNTENRITVSMSSGGGYSYQYYTNAEVTITSYPVLDASSAWLTFKVGGKNA